MKIWIFTGFRIFEGSGSLTKRSGSSFWIPKWQIDPGSRIRSSTTPILGKSQVWRNVWVIFQPIHRSTLAKRSASCTKLPNFGTLVKTRPLDICPRKLHLSSVHPLSSGWRCSTDCRILRGIGYERKRIYQGSFVDWVENGGEVVEADFEVDMTSSDQSASGAAP